MQNDPQIEHQGKSPQVRHTDGSMTICMSDENLVTLEQLQAFTRATSHDQSAGNEKKVYETVDPT